MSVEQTTQLIQLILNSVLISVACALVLGGLTARYAAIRGQLQMLNQAGADRPEGDRLEASGARQDSAFLPFRGAPTQVKKYLRRLQQSYRMTRYSLLVAYYALFFSISSCFVLAFRGMVDWNWLIPLALILFVVCMATLLVSIGLVLIDLHSSDRPLLDELNKLVSTGQGETMLRSRPRRHSSLKDKKVPTPRQRARAG